MVMNVTLNIEECHMYRRTDGSLMVMFKLNAPVAKEWMRKAIEEPAERMHIHDVPKGGKWTVILEDSE